MSIIGESDNRVARPTCAANNRGKTKKTRKVAPPIETPTPLLPLPLDRVVLRQRRISSVKMAINLGRISLSLSLSLQLEDPPPSSSPRRSFAERIRQERVLHN